jgi:hypothetical protein
VAAQTDSTHASCDPVHSKHLAVLVCRAFLLPLGVLCARHKWAVPAIMVGSGGGAKLLWYVLHVSFQLSGVACFVAGIVIAALKLEGPGEPSAHKALGYTVAGLTVLQVLVSGRPGASGALRASCRLCTSRSLKLSGRHARRSAWSAPAPTPLGGPCGICFTTT